MTADLFPLHPGDLVTIRVDDCAVPAEVYAVPDGDADAGDPSYVFAFHTGGLRQLTGGFTAEQVAELVTRAEAMTDPDCYMHRCAAPGTATGSFAGMCVPHAERARRIVADNLTN